jgi:mannose-1-phosphate guanylyltransferase
MRSRRCLWNAGIFVFRADALLEEAARHRPAVHAAAVAAASGRPRAWARAPRISLDHAILERSQRLVAVLLDAGWDDLGSWDAAVRAGEAPAGGRHVLIDSPHAAVFGDARFVAIVGVPGVVVVEEKGVVLVVARDASERVRTLVDALKRRRRTDLL